MGIFEGLIEHFSGFAFSVAAFLLVLSVVVFVHEFGHYSVAKIFGVKIETFSIGFGPEIFGLYDRSGTRWKLSMIPFGGYVKMFGDTNIASVPTSADSTIQQLDKDKSFIEKSLYKKALIIFAGPFANLVLAFFLLVLLFTFRGQQVILPVLGEIVQDSPAISAGLMPGDAINAINDCKVSKFYDIKSCLMSLSLEDRQSKINIFYSRNGSSQTSSVILNSLINEDGKLFLGVTPNGRAEMVRLSILPAISESLKDTVFIVRSTVLAIGQMVVGKRSTAEIGGPIIIAKYSAESLRQGFYQVIWFIAMISINLGVANLLPIPVLDGGHLLYYIIEAIFRKRVALKVQEYAAVAGTVIIISLTVFAVFNDIRHILK